MSKSKVTKNVGMTMAGTYSSQFVFGSFAISTEHPGFAPGLENTASAMGIAPKGLFYLIQYGLSQSMQDSIAGMAKKLDGAVWTEADNEAGKCDVADIGEPMYSDEEKEDAITNALSERFAAIKAGEIGHRVSGPRIKGPEKILRDVAWEMIVNAAQGKGVAGGLPKKVADVAEMVDKFLAVPGLHEKAKAEADRRSGAIAEPVDDTLGGLLDDLNAA